MRGGQVFPTLRLRCMQLGVHFVEVDFGWGVPEHIAERKSALVYLHMPDEDAL
ncbi:hypothetical protein T484DRAFT_1845874 [Baffinella frigidus]|nr:hypothetical protein T484DRAFT_1845874 [Cryptophyta sp. CCMP2293]